MLVIKSRKRMKKIFFIIFGFLLVENLQAQVVFSTDSKYNADLSVYVVDSKYNADLLVHKVSSKYNADGNEGLWYFTDSKYNSDKKIYFVDSKYNADLLIYFVDSKYNAGWEDKSKKHLLY